jgi:DNA polymerase-3 subunit epsilon
VIDFFSKNPNTRRKKLLRTTPPGPLRDFLAEPFPEKDTSLADAPILALDFETTGLDPKQDHILSIGFVKIDRMGIQLGSARHAIVQSAPDLKPDNVVLHQITDNEKNAGISLEAAMEMLLENLRGRILLAHFAHVETQFFYEACRNLYGKVPLLPVIDTLEIAIRQQMHTPGHTSAESVRLFNLRRQFELPEYAAHNALLDALSAAELFLALSYRLPKDPNTSLRKLYREAARAINPGVKPQSDYLWRFT